MPNWKKVIVSGSDAVLNSLSASSQISIGAVTASSEGSIILGPPPAGGAGEGGQIILQSGPGYASGSHLDNWQNNFRIMRGTNTNSQAVIAQFNLGSQQVTFPQYQNVSSFPGTATANLAVDSAGNIITVSTAGGSVFPYTGNAVITGSLTVTQAITSSGPVVSLANGAMYFRGGDDAEFWDINVVNTVGIYGQQDQGIASVKLGNGGGTISGRSGSIGIGTITPNSGALHVNGGVFATSFTGSFTGSLVGALTGTASWAVSASQATSASNADFLDGQHGSYYQNATNINAGTLANTYLPAAINVTTISASVGFTGSLTGALIGTASWAQSASNAITAQNATSADLAKTVNTVSSSVNAIFFPTFVDSNNAPTTNESLFTSNVITFNPGAQVLSSRGITAQNVQISSSLNVTGSAIFAGGITGSLLGTASWATNAISASFLPLATYSITSSWATNAISASFLPLATYSITSSWAVSASQASTASFVNNLNQNVLITGSLTVTGSTVVTGSVRGNVVALTITSNTASVNLSSGNFFTLNLVGGATTHINPTNISPGQTANIRISQSATGNGLVSFPTFVDQPSGSLYTGSQVASAVDIISLVTFDSNIVYVSSVRNLV